MKRLTLVLLSFLACLFSLSAQDRLNSEADSILGEYEVRHQGEYTKVRVTKDTDGTYKAQVYWVENRLDEDGNVRVDEKNPDKSLRHVECDKIILFSGLKYNKEKSRWDGAKVYDPTRGLRANVVCEFMEDGTFRVKGFLLGFSQSIYWKPIRMTF